MTTTQPAPEPAPGATSTTLTARSPDDLVAIVPLVLGFLPTTSVVMLTFGASRPFHARIDLPEADAAEQLATMTVQLLDPAVVHHAGRVVLLIYTDDHRRARRAWRALARGCRGRQLEVVEVLRVGEKRWFPMRGSHAGDDHVGTPYDVRHHPFALESIVSGRVVHGSRAELAATLRPDHDAVARVRAEVQRLEAAPGQAAVDLDRRAEARWMLSTLGRCVDEGSLLDDVDLARLLRALRDGVLRDVACGALDRPRATQFVDLWRDAVRRSPGWLLPPVAALLGWSAWVAGDGALAWCALDRCAELDPDYSLMLLLGELLNQAAPPTMWDELCRTAFDTDDLAAG